MLGTTLPTVETACAALQQEEAQREILQHPRSYSEVSAVYRRSGVDRMMVCTVCGIRGHPKERCWRIVGYPKTHPKYKQTTRLPPTISNLPIKTTLSHKTKTNSLNGTTKTTKNLLLMLFRDLQLKLVCSSHPNSWNN